MCDIEYIGKKVLILFKSLTLNGLLDNFATNCENILNNSTIYAILYIVIL